MVDCQYMLHSSNNPWNSQCFKCTHWFLAEDIIASGQGAILPDIWFHKPSLGGRHIPLDLRTVLLPGQSSQKLP